MIFRNLWQPSWRRPKFRFRSKSNTKCVVQNLYKSYPNYFSSHQLRGNFFVGFEKLEFAPDLAAVGFHGLQPTQICCDDDPHPEPQNNRVDLFLGKYRLHREQKY
jgi:hypothetical protein